MLLCLSLCVCVRASTGVFCLSLHDCMRTVVSKRIPESKIRCECKTPLNIVTIKIQRQLVIVFTFSPSMTLKEKVV